MAGDGIAMIEVAILLGVEVDEVFVVEPSCNAAIRCNGLNNGEVTIRNPPSICRAW
jgi:hypothetical protein